MNLRQFKIFKTLCEELSFTKTAECLGMTQPAVSHVINDLETKMGVRLFERLNHRIFLTDAGRRFLTKTLRILELYDDLKQDFIYKNVQKTIKLGSCLTIANFWLPQIAGEFSRINPLTDLQVTIDRAARIEKLLAGNDIDMALYEGVVPGRQFYAEEFSSYEISYIASPKHDLATQKALPLEEILKYNLLIREEGSAIRATLDSALLLHNLKVKPLWSSVNSQALVQGALQNIGIAVLPEIIVKAQLEEGRLVKLDVGAEPMINHNYIVFHPEKYITEPMRTLIKIIQRMKNVPVL